MNKCVVFLLSVIANLVISCKKEEGPGGTSSVSGTVYYNFYDHNGTLISREQAPKEEVFIEYGDEEFYGDDIDTDENGFYIFRYLTPGTYTLFSFEDCNTCLSGDRRVETAVEIGKKRTEAVAPDLELTKYLDVDDGSGTIRGKLFAKDFNSSGTLTAQYYLAEERVYLVYGTDSVYYDDMRTHADGTYEFKNLIPGVYTVYAYSKCDTMNNALNYTNCVVPEYKSGTITEAGMVVTLEDIVVTK